MKHQDELDTDKLEQAAWICANEGEKEISDACIDAIKELTRSRAIIEKIKELVL